MKRFKVAAMVIDTEKHIVYEEIKACAIMHAIGLFQSFIAVDYEISIDALSELDITELD